MSPKDRLTERAISAAALRGMALREDDLTSPQAYYEAASRYLDISSEIRARYTDLTIHSNRPLELQLPNAALHLHQRDSYFHVAFGKDLVDKHGLVGTTVNTDALTEEESSYAEENMLLDGTHSITSILADKPSVMQAIRALFPNPNKERGREEEDYLKPEQIGLRMLSEVSWIKMQELEEVLAKLTPEFRESKGLPSPDDLRRSLREVADKVAELARVS